jgi:hypothetical protein
MLPVLDQMKPRWILAHCIVILKAVPWFRLLASPLLYQPTPGLDSSSVHVAFIADKVALG